MNADSRRRHHGFLCAASFALVVLEIAACSSHSPHGSSAASNAPPAASGGSPLSATTPGKLTPGVFLENGQGPPAGVTLRTVDSSGMTLTQDSEGFVGHLYNDAVGYCTVAYGHLVHKSPCNGTEPGNFIPDVSQILGTSLLVSDMAVAQYAVMTTAPSTLTDDQFASLVDFTYNVGAQNFSSSTLLRLIKAGDYTAVPDEWNKWVLADGQLIEGLVTRRKNEINLFFDGHPPVAPQVRLREVKPGVKPVVKLIDIRVGG
jgi:lysozyme